MTEAKPMIGGDPVTVANDRCTCAEVYGEDPDCVLHGVETDWALENTLPDDWQNQVLEQRHIIKSLTRDLAEARGKAIEECAKVADQFADNARSTSFGHMYTGVATAIRSLIQKDSTL